jgi:two-component sensor histidine kinase
MQDRLRQSHRAHTFLRAFAHALAAFRAGAFPDEYPGETTQVHRLDLLRHELRTPVTGILGMCELLQKSNLTGEQFQFASAVEESGKQLLRLIADFGLDDFQQGGGSAAGRHALNGAILLEQVIRAHWPAAHTKGIGLFLLYDHRLSACWHSSVACLRQLLDNLLSNAIKFTNEGHVLVEVRLLQPDASGRADVELVVCDTGIGIARRDAQRIYGIREQGSGEIAERFGGSGLGLHVCTRMASLLGGSITHESTEPGGSRFRVTIPGLADRGARAFDRLQPRLLADVRCLLAVGPLRTAVLEQLLLRIGVQVAVIAEPQGSGIPVGVDCMICDPASLINGMAHAQGASAGNAVVLLSRPYAHDPVTGAAVQGAVVTQLPEPILRSNLEPLLMRVALQRKLQATSESPD